MTQPFADRHVVVTGGTGALGSAVVAALLEAGATCHVPVRRQAEVADFALASDARVHCVGGVDLTDELQVEAFYGRVPSLWASLQVAGGFAMAPLAKTRLADLERLWAMNARSCFLCCREAVARMRDRGDAAGGRLVNVAARPALVPTGGMAAYSITKAAVASLTVSLAEELAPEGIWVNAVVPSIMDTPANRAAMPDADHGRWPSVEAVAATMVFLASPENQTTRGALVPVYGRS